MVPIMTPSRSTSDSESIDPDGQQEQSSIGSTPSSPKTVTFQPKTLKVLSIEVYEKYKISLSTLTITPNLGMKEHPRVEISCLITHHPNDPLADKRLLTIQKGRSVARKSTTKNGSKQAKKKVKIPRSKNISDEQLAQVLKTLIADNLLCNILHDSGYPDLIAKINRENPGLMGVTAAGMAKHMRTKFVTEIFTKNGKRYHLNEEEMNGVRKIIRKCQKKTNNKARKEIY
ncbi:uncharacterized protein LOC107046600 [Diachasma alloeum]|uniref:uncharacterized protein LOC107046600 n=1 Tax=Diachasma alloeum TaxID=454923 RepID=UPI000738232A|nr:uncharacterized protein LOC107046600 [Diachasma alloeum]